MGTGTQAHLLGVGRVRQKHREAVFRDVKRALHTGCLVLALTPSCTWLSVCSPIKWAHTPGAGGRSVWKS